MPLHRLFFYLTIILLPTQLGKHFWPDWSFVVGRRVDYLSPTLFLTDITIILTLISWLIENITNYLPRRQAGELRITNKVKNLKSLPASLPPYLPIFFLISLFISLNIFLAISPIVALYKWIKILEFVFFGVYIVKTKPNVRNILIGLSVAVLYSSIIAIIQFFSQRSLGGMFWFLGERTFDITTPGIARIQILPFSIFHSALYIIHSSELLRPYATFPHPNVLGGFLAITLPLLIWNNMLPFSNKILISQCVERLRFAGKTKPWTQRAITFLNLLQMPTIILGYIALILTFSRSAWIAGIVGTLCALILLKREKILSYWYYLILVIIGLFVLTLPYFQTLTPQHESVFIRSELNSAAVQMILPENHDLRSKNYELFTGVGLGNYLVELPTYYPHREIFFLQPVHNIYLLLLSETGIIGLGLFLFLLWRIVKKRGKHKPSPYLSAEALAKAGLPLSLSLYLLIGVVDHYPLTTQQGLLFLTLLIALNVL